MTTHRGDMCAVLDESIRPELPRSFVVALIEERVERLEND
jgi:hypothetical protein